MTDYACLNCAKPIALVTMTKGAQAGQQVWVHLDHEGAQRLTCRRTGPGGALPHARWFSLA